jgi:hypothetical protein
MRYVIAVTVSVCLIVGMFAYANWIESWEKQWQNYDAKLPTIAMLGVDLAYFIRAFWYAIIPFLLAIPLAIAALWTRKKRLRHEDVS